MENLKIKLKHTKPMKKKYKHAQNFSKTLACIYPIKQLKFLIITTETYKNDNKTHKIPSIK